MGGWLVGGWVGGGGGEGADGPGRRGRLFLRLGRGAAAGPEPARLCVCVRGGGVVDEGCR